jgi:hypothetical protein
MRRLLALIAALFTPLITASCATTMTVSWHLKRGLDFTPYRSFDSGPAGALPTGDPRLDQDPFKGVIDDQEWLEKRIDETVGRILNQLPRRQ